MLIMSAYLHHSRYVTSDHHEEQGKHHQTALMQLLFLRN